MVTKGKLRYEETHFRVLASTLTAHNGVHYVLSFERSVHDENKSIHALEDNAKFHSREGHPSAPNGSLGIDRVLGAPRDILRIKKAVFDRCNVVGFILSVDEKFYITNKKTRELLADVMGVLKVVMGSA